MDMIELREYGTMKVNARRLKDDTFPVWTAVQDCELERCVAHTMCPYYAGIVDSNEKGTVANPRKCVVLMKYLKQVEKIIIENFADKMDELDRFRVGMQLIPLYKQLARFKIIEMSLSSRDIPELTKSGTTKVHSVFKEIREVIKTIDACWSELGIIARRKKRPATPEFTAEQGYYERMETDALKEQKRLKLVRRNNGKVS